MKPQRTKESAILNNILNQYLRPEKWSILLLALIIFIGVCVENINPFLYGKMVDCISKGQLDQLLVLIGLYCGATLTALTLGVIERRWGELLSFRVGNRIRRDALEKIVYTRLERFLKNQPGELISRISGDTENITTFFIDIFGDLGQVAVSLSISAYFILTISPRLSTVAIFYVPATFLCTYILRKKFKRIAAKQRRVEDQNTSFLNETMNKYEGIKTFQLEKRTLTVFDGIIADKLRLTRRKLRIDNVSACVNTLISLFSSMYIVYISALLIREGALTIGAMVSFNTYINVLFGALEKIWNYSINKQAILVSAGRINEILEAESESANPGELGEGKPDASNPGAGKLPLPAAGIHSIEMRNVSFSYPQSAAFALRDLNLAITEPGCYAVVGKNGCGKSTFAKLLPRLYEVTSGRAALNGRAISEYSLDSVRRAVTYVPKGEFFLRDTIYANLTLYEDSISREEVLSLCRAIGIHSLIASLPRQYDTVMEEKGFSLSSGQMQKLTVVRALLRKSSVLVFDEVTANLDGKSEKEIMEAMKQYGKDHIVINISHKIGAIAGSDKIFLMGAGRVEACGTHEELMAASPDYRELFARGREDISESAV